MQQTANVTARTASSVDEVKRLSSPILAPVLAKLNQAHREATATGHPKMAFST
jgi:hypothetical protein